MMENTSMKRSGSLGESVDILRDCMDGISEDIKELYDLDEDNYKMIRDLQTKVDGVKTFTNKLAERVRKHRAKTVLGFISFGGLLYVGYKCIESLQNRVYHLEADHQASKKPEETEESDG